MVIMVEPYLQFPNAFHLSVSASLLLPYDKKVNVCDQIAVGVTARPLLIFGKLNALFFMKISNKVIIFFVDRSLMILLIRNNLLLLLLMCHNEEWRVIMILTYHCICYECTYVSSYQHTYERNY